MSSSTLFGQSGPFGYPQPMEAPAVYGYQGYSAPSYGYQGYSNPMAQPVQPWSQPVYPNSYPYADNTNYLPPAPGIDMSGMGYQAGPMRTGTFAVDSLSTNLPGEVPNSASPSNAEIAAMSARAFAAVEQSNALAVSGGSMDPGQASSTNNGVWIPNEIVEGEINALSEATVNQDEAGQAGDTPDQTQSGATSDIVMPEPEVQGNASASDEWTATDDSASQESTATNNKATVDSDNIAKAQELAEQLEAAKLKELASLQQAQASAKQAKQTQAELKQSANKLSKLQKKLAAAEAQKAALEDKLNAAQQTLKSTREKLNDRQKRQKKQPLRVKPQPQPTPADAANKPAINDDVQSTEETSSPKLTSEAGAKSKSVEPSSSVAQPAAEKKVADDSNTTLPIADKAKSMTKKIDSLKDAMAKQIKSSTERVNADFKTRIDQQLSNGRTAEHPEVKKLELERDAQLKTTRKKIEQRYQRRIDRLQKEIAALSRS